MHSHLFSPFKSRPEKEGIKTGFRDGFHGQFRSKADLKKKGLRRFRTATSTPPEFKSRPEKEGIKTDWKTHYGKTVAVQKQT